MDAFVDLLSRRFELGNLSFTPASLLLGIALLILLSLAARALRRLLRDRILPRAGMARGVSIALATLTYYLVMLVGTLILLPVMVSGFNLQTLSLMLGAISFGI